MYINVSDFMINNQLIHKHSYTHMYAHIYTRKHTHIHMQTSTHMYIRIHTHLCTYMYALKSGVNF